VIVFVIMTSFADYRKLNFIGPKLLLEASSGQKCLMVHFSQISYDEIADLAPSAVVWSGGLTPVEDNDGILDNIEIRRLMQEWPGPQLAICYSAQLRVRYDGGRVASMGPLTAGECDPNPHYRPGMRKEFGIYPVTVTQSSDLFAGLGATIMVSEEHGLEIAALPSGFVPLAHSERCEVQAYRVENQPFYGVQFHPEKHRITGTYGDGARVLENFFSLSTRPSV
jgi:GMP synthase (glutamine-hydrolysing)